MQSSTSQACFIIVYLNYIISENAFFSEFGHILNIMNPNQSQ